MDQTKRTITQADILAIMEAMEERFVTKEEYLNYADKLCEDIKAERDERQIMQKYLLNHENRIVQIETRLVT